MNQQFINSKRKLSLIIALLMFSLNIFAHSWEIRVTQNQNGTLTWWSQSYHQITECGIVNSGITINGVNYPFTSGANGSIIPFASYVFTYSPTYYNVCAPNPAFNNACGSRASWGSVTTPYIAGTLNVQVFSPNQCFSPYPDMPAGNGAFNPPPPPVCTSCPITSWTNTITSPGNNNGTPCNATDDFTSATITVNHLACASITGTGKFNIVFDPGGANVAYGPYAYTNGIQTVVTGINIPYGTSSSTQLLVSDAFPCTNAHGLSIPGGQYQGEGITSPSFQNYNPYVQASTNASNCLATVTYPLSVSGTSPTVTYQFTGATVASGSGTGSGQVFQKGITHVAVTASNSCGTVISNFDITVVDDVVPIAVCKPATVYLDATGHATVTPADIDNGSSDNCGTVNLSINNTGTICGTAAEGSSVTITAPAGTTITAINFASYGTPTGSCGNFVLGGCHASNSVSIVSGLAIGQNSVTIPASNGVFGDPCFGTVKRLYIQATYSGYGTSNIFDCSHIGNNTVTLKVTDAAGNVSTCNAVVTVVDNINPTITCPGNQIRSTNNNLCTYTAVGGEFEPTFGDNCAGVTITNNLNSSNTLAGYVFAKGTTTVIWTAMDASENSASCSFSVTVNDTQNPTITCVGNQVRNNTNATVCTYTTVGNEFNPTTFADNCPGSTITNNLSNTNTLAGYVFSNGTTTVTWTVTDAAGLTTTCSFTIRVNDNTAPIVACPANQDINLNATCAAALPDYRSLLTVSDNCTASGSLVITQTPSPGTTLSGTGTLTVSFTVRDASNNSTTCSITLTKKDVTAPTITCPAPISVNNNLGICGAVVNYTLPVASDNCAGSQSSGVHVLNPGMQFFDFADNRLETQNSPGLPLTFNPTDGQKMAVFLQNCGSTHNMYQNVILPASGSITLSFDLQYKNHSGSFSSQQFIAVELRNITTNALIQTLFKTLPGDPLSKPMTSYSYNISGLAGQQVRFQIIDATINNFYFDVLLDNIKIPGSNLTNGSFETGNYNGWTINSSNGFCGTFGIGSGLGVSLSQTAGLPSGSTFPVGITTNTFKATDASGNSSSCSFDVTVTDNEAPSITCAANQTQTADEGQCGAQVTVIAPTTGDNCGVASVTNNYNNTNNASGVYPVGTTSVIWTVTDIHGNTNTCTQTITVTDDEAPAITCNAPISVNNDEGICGAVVDYTVTYSDNCPGQTVAQTAGLPSGSVFPVGVTTNTFVVTDAHNNTATCSFTVTVTDNETPTIVCPSNKTVNCQDDKTPTANGTATATDNCTAASNIVINYTDVSTQNASSSNADYYNYVITRTWRATDVAGNFSECVQTITVQDVTAPVITCPASVTVNCQDNNTSSSTGVATATDNCSPVTITQSQTSTQSSNPNTGGYYNYVITRTWRATDVTGNFSECVQTITVQDVTNPVISCPVSGNAIRLTNPGLCTYKVQSTEFNATATDNCSVRSLVYTLTGATTGTGTSLKDVLITRGTTTVTWTATDGVGHQVSCSFTILVNDDQNATDYMIYAEKEAKFSEYHFIGGDVGVTASNGKADFKKYDVLDPYKVTAANISFDMPSSVANRFYFPATGGPAPTFYPYNGSTTGLSNIDVTVNNTTLNGNYKDVKVKNGITATITGNNFGKITIEEGAKVTFTAAVINMKELTVQKGKKNDNILTIVNFTNSASVKVKDRVTIEDDCRVNVNGPKVTFYTGDNTGGDEKFSVRGENTQVTANIMVPEGKLSVHGGNDITRPTIMIGWYIIEKLDGNGKYVYWKKYNCGTVTNPSFSRMEVPAIITKAPVVVPAVTVTPAQKFEVKLYPNPTAGDFNIQVITESSEQIMVKIMNVNGTVVQASIKLTKQGLITLVSKLSGGTYFVEVTQGKNRQVVKLIRLN